MPSSPPTGSTKNEDLAPFPEGSLSGPGWFEIRIRDHVDLEWSEHFAGMRITHEGEGVTVLAGLIADQASLHGLLARIRDLGLPLLSLQRLGDRDPSTGRPSEGVS